MLGFFSHGSRSGFHKPRIGGSDTNWNSGITVQGFWGISGEIRRELTKIILIEQT
jgi:hypothetical protein